jgi:uncharacterized protein YerC
MSVESVAKSIQMLKGILDGKTYVAIARDSGLSRSAVEQRVKALARELQTGRGGSDSLSRTKFRQLKRCGARPACDSVCPPIHSST